MNLPTITQFARVCAGFGAPLFAGLAPANKLRTVIMYRVAGQFLSAPAPHRYPSPYGRSGASPCRPPAFLRAACAARVTGAKNFPLRYGNVSGAKYDGITFGGEPKDHCYETPKYFDYGLYCFDGLRRTGTKFAIFAFDDRGAVLNHRSFGQVAPVSRVARQGVAQILSVRTKRWNNGVHVCVAAGGKNPSAKDHLTCNAILSYLPLVASRLRAVATRWANKPSLAQGLAPLALLSPMAMLSPALLSARLQTLPIAANIHPAANHNSNFYAKATRASASGGLLRVRHEGKTPCSRRS